MSLKLYNTETRSVDDFIPLEEGKVKLYCCGPTVYDYAHIGNLRTYVFEDILVKTFRRAGYQVKHVMNITDVGHLTSDLDSGEDKMLVGAERERKNVLDLARFYEDAFMKDCAALNIAKPTVVCRATEYINEIIEFIQGLEAKGFVYVAGGNVYLDSGKVRDYGRMAHLDLENLMHGSRVEEDPNKRNPTDSVLWFTSSKFKGHILSWKSPWGDYGYPGWNIECSTMALKNLGERADIHCGGVDHINVHHTNEIAQSESLLGHRWINVWMHGEFLQLKNEKMAKSKTFITLQTLIDKGYAPMHYRYFCLTAHYRSQLSFSYEGLDGARAAYENLLKIVSKLQQEAQADAGAQETGENPYLAKFDGHLYNDLNMPQALATVWSMLKDSALSAQDKLDAIYAMDGVLSLDIRENAADLRLKNKQSIPPAAQALLDERQAARQSKDWKRSDELRDKLAAAHGIDVKDLPDGKYEIQRRGG